MHTRPESLSYSGLNKKKKKLEHVTIKTVKTVKTVKIRDSYTTLTVD